MTNKYCVQQRVYSIAVALVILPALQRNISSSAGQIVLRHSATGTYTQTVGVHCKVHRLKI